jgi:TetR/AcrR family transcriptional regulator, transcriptional repressor for nem operon
VAETRSAAERILERARELFLVQGYHHTSPDQIMAAAGVSKSTFYYHYRSKEELGRAVVVAFERYYWERRLMPTIGDTSRPAGERLRAWFATAARAFEARDCRGGCPVAFLGLELAGENDALRTHLHQILLSWREPLAACLADGIAAGELRADLPAEALAELLIAQYEGALILAVIDKSAAPLRRVAALLPLLLGVPAAPSQAGEAVASRPNTD